MVIRNNALSLSAANWNFPNAESAIVGSRLIIDFFLDHVHMTF